MRDGSRRGSRGRRRGAGRGLASLVVLVACAMVMAGTVSARAEVLFDRAFGVNVDPSDGSTGDFENCTSASGCQAGSSSSIAGGLNSPFGVAVDAAGRILVAERSNHRISRFLGGR